MPLELYRFRYFDQRRGRWIEARYRATKEEIAARYERFELMGEPWTPPSLGASASHLAAPAPTGVDSRRAITNAGVGDASYTTSADSS